jgi:hypothetical protein
MNEEIESAAISQLRLLRRRLVLTDVVGFEDFDRAKGNWHFDEETGWIRVWWVIDEVTYTAESPNGSTPSDGPIHVVHEVGGVREWAELDEDGKPTEWVREAPPWTTLN